MHTRALVLHLSSFSLDISTSHQIDILNLDIPTIKGCEIVLRIQHAKRAINGAYDDAKGGLISGWERGREGHSKQTS